MRDIEDTEYLTTNYSLKSYFKSTSFISLVYLLLISIGYRCIDSYLNGFYHSSNHIPNDYFSLLIYTCFGLVTIAYLGIVYFYTEKKYLKGSTITRWVKFSILVLIVITLSFLIAHIYPELSNWINTKSYKEWALSGDYQILNPDLDIALMLCFLATIIFGGIAFRNFIKFHEPCENYPCSITNYLEIGILISSYFCFTKAFALLSMPIFCCILFDVSKRVRSIKNTHIEYIFLRIVFYALLILMFSLFGPFTAPMSVRGGGPVTLYFGLCVYSLMAYPIIVISSIIIWLKCFIRRRKKTSPYFNIVTFSNILIILTPLLLFVLIACRVI